MDPCKIVLLHISLLNVVNFDRAFDIIVRLKYIPNVLIYIYIYPNGTLHFIFFVLSTEKTSPSFPFM